MYNKNAAVRDNTKLVHADNIFDAIRKLRGYNLEPDFIPKVGKPTQYEPGTAEKVEVMVRRLEAGEALFHPADKLDYTDCTRYVRPSTEFERAPKDTIKMDRVIRKFLVREDMYE